VALRKERIFVDRLDEGVLARQFHFVELVRGAAQKLNCLVVEQRHNLRAGVVFQSAGSDEAAFGG
jgi:hypothetical protein